MIGIGPPKNRDIAGILALLHQLWPDQELDDDALASMLSRARRSVTRRCLCARDKEKTVIGFCSLSIHESLWQAGRVGHVDELVVAAHHRRQGIGRALLSAIAELARKTGCVRLELDTALHRVDAHRFYLKQGFERRAWLFSRPIQVERAHSRSAH